MGAVSTEIQFELVPNWPDPVADWPRAEAPGIAVDGEDNVYLFVRGEIPVRIYDRTGHAVHAWEGVSFERPHAIATAGGLVYCVDDWGHAVSIFSPDGQLTVRLERSPDVEYPQLTDPEHPDTILTAGPPFNLPTGIAISPTGDSYVSDGYGNARLHHFDPARELAASWGSPGSDPGQFRLPHGVAIDAGGRLYVSDRLNCRVQVFSADGAYLTEWPARWPNNVVFDPDGLAYVAELGGVFADGPAADLAHPRARVTVRDRSGAVLTELLEPDPTGSGRFYAPHAVAIDSHGDLYVTEVPDSYTFGQAPASWPVVRKYARVG
jgi:DNA-binding beta-propeller fold protein YncE